MTTLTTVALVATMAVGVANGAVLLSTSTKRALKDLFAPIDRISSELQAALGAIDDQTTLCDASGYKIVTKKETPFVYKTLDAIVCNEAGTSVTKIDFSSIPVMMTVAMAAGDSPSPVLRLNDTYLSLWTPHLSSVTNLTLAFPVASRALTFSHLIGDLSRLSALTSLTACDLPRFRSRDGPICCQQNGSPNIPSGSPCLNAFVKEYNGGLPQAQCVNCCKNMIMDNGETGVDCGGPCSDCLARSNCFNNIQDGNERGVDCGGLCANDCCANGFLDGGEDTRDCGGVCEECKCSGMITAVPACNKRTGSSCDVVSTCGTACSSGGCSKNDCADVFYGWVGIYCRLFEGVGRCASTTGGTQGSCAGTIAPSECVNLSRMSRLETQVCDIACQKPGTCVQGTVSVANNSAMSDLCYTSGEQRCGSGQECSSFGRCIPRRTTTTTTTVRSPFITTPPPTTTSTKATTPNDSNSTPGSSAASTTPSAGSTTTGTTGLDSTTSTQPTFTATTATTKTTTKVDTTKSPRKDDTKTTATGKTSASDTDASSTATAGDSKSTTQPPPSGTPTDAAAVPGDQSSDKGLPVPAIVGGVIGGCVLLSALVVGLLCWSRRKSGGGGNASSYRDEDDVDLYSRPPNGEASSAKSGIYGTVGDMGAPPMTGEYGSAPPLSNYGAAPPLGKSEYGSAPPID
jgi:hypothetical protein